MNNLKTQVNCELIYSQISQFCLASPINVRIHPKYAASECCGVSCFNCSTLSNAIGNYTMVGTIFSLYPHSTPHIISNTIPIKVNDIKIVGLNYTNKVDVDCWGVQCFDLSSNGVIFGIINNILIIIIIILEYLSFQNGTTSKETSGGFIGIPSSTRLYLRNIFISQMTGYLSGGAIYNNGLLYASDTTFFKNKAPDAAGAIFTGSSGVLGALTCARLFFFFFYFNYF